MEISKRSFLLLLLYLPSYKAFSCVGPMDVTELYSERKSRGIPYIGPSAEEFLNRTYGENNWQYDDNLFLKLPEIPENPSFVLIETGMNRGEVTSGYVELTIFAEEFIWVHHRGITGRFKENVVFEIAKFKFYESSYPYVSTRLNLLGGAGVTIFCVFTPHNKEWVRVIRPPKSMSTGGSCGSTTYIKD